MLLRGHLWRDAHGAYRNGLGYRRPRFKIGGAFALIYGERRLMLIRKGTGNQTTLT